MTNNLLTSEVNRLKIDRNIMNYASASMLTEDQVEDSLKEKLKKQKLFEDVTSLESNTIELTQIFESISELTEMISFVSKNIESLNS